MLGGGKRNFWPGTSFSGLADLNRMVREWLDTVANVRIHGTTHERPVERLAAERKHLHPLPEQERVQVFLREERKVSRDGYVAWDGARYGVHWSHAGRVVHVQASGSLVEVWSGA